MSEPAATARTADRPISAAGRSVAGGRQSPRRTITGPTSSDLHRTRHLEAGQVRGKIAITI
jgi:hypothetical protein